MTRTGTEHRKLRAVSSSKPRTVSSPELYQAQNSFVLSNTEQTMPGSRTLSNYNGLLNQSIHKASTQNKLYKEINKGVSIVVWQLSNFACPMYHEKTKEEAYKPRTFQGFSVNSVGGDSGQDGRTDGGDNHIIPTFSQKSVG
ncbi:hypothetical protein DPMN_045029 [Dreissena polymorpha]|uniref:Uncharacterized protein n=1 Tax=Dreissena polymorpha TaxID=45954 RepID=A0A9D4D5Q3_DREPO|nr:hypothetical protein DPMN_045029 [Dreissena polymorpha]